MINLQVNAQATNEVRGGGGDEKEKEHDALQLSRPRASMAKQRAMADLGCEEGETCEKPHS